MGRRFVGIVTAFVLSATAALAGDGEPRSLAALFPGVTGIDETAVYPLWSPEYQAFVKCQTSADKAVDCPAAGTPRFYRFSESPEVEDAFDFANRCVAIGGGATRISKGPIAVVGGKLVCTTGPSEVVEAQLVLCYGLASGAFCSFATACFEGSGMTGQCTKDYPAEQIYVPMNMTGGGGGGGPSKTVKCNATWCYLGRVRTATCYGDGSSTLYPVGASGCSPEQGGTAPCNDPSLCVAPTGDCSAPAGMTCGQLGDYAVCRAGTANYCNCSCVNDSSGLNVSW